MDGGPVEVKGKKIIIESIESKEVQPVIKDWTGGEFPCVDCGTKEAIELGRCRGCDIKHREIVARFDSRPRAPELERPPVQATYRKEASQGVIVTIQRLEPLR